MTSSSVKSTTTGANNSLVYSILDTYRVRRLDPRSSMHLLDKA